MQTEPGVVTAATRGLLTQKAGELCDRGGGVDIQPDSGRDRTVIAETAKALHKGPIQDADLAVGADAPIVGSRFQIIEQPEIVAAVVIVRIGRSLVSLGRISEAKANHFVLRQNRDVEVA